MSIQIEKNIPLPTTKPNGAANVTQTLRIMDVGDSILLPKEKRASIYQQLNKVGGDKRFVTRTVDPEHFRVWRVA